MPRIATRKDTTRIVAELQQRGIDCDALSIVTDTGEVLLHRGGVDIEVEPAVLQAAIDAAPDLADPEPPEPELDPAERRELRALLRERGRRP